MKIIDDDEKLASYIKTEEMTEINWILVLMFIGLYLFWFEVTPLLFRNIF